MRSCAGRGCAGPPRGAALRSPVRSYAADHQRDVVAAEAEGVVQGSQVAVWQLARRSGDDVEVDRWVLVLDVDRRWNEALVERQHDGERLDRTGSTQKVADHRLRTGDTHVVGRRSED